MSKFQKNVYGLPKWLLIVPFVVALIYIIVGTASEETVGIIGADGRFAKPFEKILGLSYYWFFLLVGIIVIILFSIMRREKYGFGMIFSIVFPVFFFLQALIGAKFLFGLEKVVSTGKFSAFDISGQSLYGTLFTTFSLAPLVALFTRKKLSLIYDYMASLWMILLIFCRMGCFTDGCCGADILMFGNQAFYLPVQLFEMVFDFGVLALLFSWEENKLTWDKTDSNSKNPNLYHGILFFVMLALYGVYRFVLEFFRNNPVMFLGMTFGQIYCLIILIVAGFVLWHRFSRYQLELKRLSRTKKKKAK